MITPAGDEVLTDYGSGFENTIGSFGQFSESGYATAEGYIDSRRCFFYIKPTGEIAWMFSDSPQAGAKPVGHGMAAILRTRRLPNRFPRFPDLSPG